MYRQQTGLVHADTGSLGEGGVGAHSRHGGTGLSVQEDPHQECQQSEEQQAAGGDYQIDAEPVQVDLQELRQELIVKAFQRDGGTQALTGKAPNHRRALVGQQQPHHAHE